MSTYPEGTSYSVRSAPVGMVGLSKRPLKAYNLHVYIFTYNMCYLYT